MMYFPMIWRDCDTLVTELRFIYLSVSPLIYPFVNCLYVIVIVQYRRAMIGVGAGHLPHDPNFL